jgi:type II secretory pathway component GspD/PulD (secretin)
LRGRVLCLGLVSLWLIAAVTIPETETRVIFLKSLTSSQAVKLYERVLGVSPETHLSEGRAVGSVVVRDTTERLDRFGSLLARLDVAELDRARIYARPTTYRLPSELQVLAEAAWKASGEEEVYMAAVDRSWLLVVHARPRAYARLDKLLRRLDVRPPRRRP